MKSRMRSFLILLFLTSVSLPAHASKMSKGFEAIKIHDYFKAKELFTKSIKRNPSAAAFGLATIYSRNNNAFYSKDSAYVFLQMAEQEWGNSKEKKREKWGIYGWNEAGIDELRKAIELLYFEEARSANSIAVYTQFIHDFPKAIQISKVVVTRDSIAFFRAMNENTAMAYRQFTELYPTSIYVEIAKENYFDAQFEEVTGKGTLASFLAFIELNPKSPMVPHAEVKVFDIVTESNTAEAYSAFINTYPNNQFVDSAWRQLYQASISDYSLEALEKFKTDYPAYPYLELVDLEILSLDSILFPNYVNEKYGFIEVDGTQNISPIYEQVSSFHEGLAVVMLDGKYGVIDFTGKTRIDFKYDAISDFFHGRAIIEVDEKMGLLHRSGKQILACEFEDLGMISDGLIYANRSGKYGYYDETGRLRIPEKYDDAFDFSKGVAKVEINGSQAYIDIYGAYVAQPAYPKISIFSDTLFSFEDDGLIGLMDRLANVVIPAQFDELGRIHEGLAIASIEGEVVYLNDQGEIVIRDEFEVFPNFISRGEFINGRAVVMKDDDYGRIDLKGKTALSFKYENLGTGTDAIPFEDDEYWGVINPAGKVLISADYYGLRIEDNAYVIAKNENGTGVLNLAGNVIVPFTFDEIEYLGNEIFVVQMADSLGIMRNDSLVVPIKYDSIGTFGEDFLFLSKSGVLSYYDLNTGKLITTKEENGG
jgi:hypothetical protein